MSFRRAKLALDVLTVFLVVAGVLFWVLEPPIPRVEASQSPARSGSSGSRSVAPASGRTVADANAIVEGNMFSASRAAPRVRYTPPTAGSSGIINEPATVEMAAVPVELPRVYGVMNGPSGAMALIQPDSAGASGRIFREGDRVGVFRIEKILGASIIVRGPSGRVEIHVEPQLDRKQ